MNAPELMNRRAALSRLALLMSGAVIGGDAFLRGAAAAGQPAGPDFSPADVALLDEIGETIIPATDTPGAKAANIGAFMVMMVRDCYDTEQQGIFQAGLGQLEEASRRLNGKSFLASSPAERTALLNQLDAEERHQRAGVGSAVHYFRMLKQLTILGYFSSEIGCTKALRYVETPGSFNGNVPYKKGDRAWFVATSRGF